jgi:hypothetical protein
MPETKTDASADVAVSYSQWGYAIERRWFPGHSKPLLVGFARILASNYDGKRGYICVSQGILAKQCGMSTRATGELMRRVVNDHKLFRQVGQWRPNKGGKSIAKLVLQLPPENLRETGAREGTMPVPAEEAPAGRILPIDDPWADTADSQQEEFVRPANGKPRSADFPIGRILPIISSRDYLRAADAAPDDDYKINTDLEILGPGKSEALAERLLESSDENSTRPRTTGHVSVLDREEWSCRNGCKRNPDGTGWHVWGNCPRDE